MMNIPLMTVHVFSEFLPVSGAWGSENWSVRQSSWRFFHWVWFHAACHCFGSQRLTVALPLPSLTLICCGIRARGWALRCFICAVLDIIMLERAMYPSVLLLDSGRDHPCSVKVQSLFYPIISEFWKPNFDIRVLFFFSLHFELP